MPFTVNVGPYQGGSYLASGLSNLGSGIADAIKEMRQAQQDEAADNLIIQHAMKTGQISPEQYTQFLNGSRTQKNGIVAGLARNFAMDIQQQQLETLKAQRAALNFTPRVMNFDENGNPIYPQAEPVQPYDIPPAGSTPTPTARFVEVRKGQWEPIKPSEVSGAGGLPVATSLKTDSGEDTGLLSITLPGSKNLQIVPAPDSGIEYDEETGLYGTRNKSGFKPLDAQSQSIAQEQRNRNLGLNQQVKKPSLLEQAWNVIQSARATPTPTPAAAAAPAAAVDPLRQRAINTLTSAGKPVTEANIQAVIKKLGGG